MAAKLVIVEGLPGSGKSTISSLVNDILGEMRINSRLYPEGDPDHPADFESAALLNSGDFIKLIADFPEHRALIERFSRELDGKLLISYGKVINELAGEIPEGLIDRLVVRDIYELPLTEHMELVVNRWNNFSSRALQEDTVSIFECCFIQNPITVTMIRDNSRLETSLNYIRRLEDSIRDLDPVLIYLNQADAEYSFRRVFDERSESWLDFFVDYYTNRGYGRANNLKGVEGAVRLLQERQQIELEIFRSLEIKKVLLDNSQYNYEKVSEELREILEGIG